MEPTLLIAAVGLVLFAGLSLVVITVYKLVRRLRTPSSVLPTPIPQPAAIRPRDSLVNDPKLMAFFKRVDPQFQTPAPPVVPTPIQPIVTVQTTDVDLAAITQIWPQLSHRDRRELRRLAELKRDGIN